MTTQSKYDYAFLRKAFPPFTESAIFVMTISLITVIFLDKGSYHNVVSAMSEYFFRISVAFELNKSFYENVKAILALTIIFPAFIIGTLFSALYLPFTKKDLRALSAIIPIIHVIILLIVNSTFLKEDTNITNILFFIYSLAWVIMMLLKVDPKVSAHVLISPKHDSGMNAILLASTSFTLIFILMIFFEVDWTIAYSSSFFYSIYAGAIVQTISQNKL